MNWHTIVITAVILLAIALMVLEVRRANKARLFSRLLATLVALGALLAMALPWRLPAGNDVPAANVLVLTDGFDPDTVAALYRPHTTVYAADSIAWRMGQRWNAQWMPFPENWPQPGHRVHVLGNGLSPWQLVNPHFIFHPGDKKEGITHIHWNQQLPAGTALQVQGQYQSKQPLKVVLYGLNTPLDSATTSPFTLAIRPKHSGGAVYRFIALRGKDTLSNDPLPVYVTPADTLKVLLLAAMPDAENRFLKDWLGGHGSKVAMRTDISKGKLDQAFMNQEKTTALDFPAYDVVVADAAALQGLPMAVLNNLRQQVEQGMGLIVKADSGQSNAAFYTSGITLQAAPAGQLQDIHLPNAAPLHGEQTLYMTAGQAWQPLAQDEKGHVYSALKAYGRGKIVATTLRNTYSWLLASQAGSYEKLWSDALHKAAREKPTSLEERINTAFPLQQAPVEVLAYSDQPPADTSFSFSRNRDIPFLWRSLQWPQRSGWQYAAGQPWFAYAPTDWAALRANERLRATAAAAQQAGHAAAMAGAGGEGAPVSPTWLFLAFLVAAGWLWLERKL